MTDQQRLQCELCGKLSICLLPVQLGETPYDKPDYNGEEFALCGVCATIHIWLAELGLRRNGRSLWREK